jgi:hypothetical protein
MHALALQYGRVTGFGRSGTACKQVVCGEKRGKKLAALETR